jgi:ribA/ribD-fused uncharacterized protein
MEYSLEHLMAQITAGYQPKYLHFWGHTPAAPGIVDKSCFSQWYPAPFEVEDVQYPTAEHFMMAQKALLFGDREVHDKIVQSTHPNEAKRLGREVRAFDAAVWEAERMNIVVRGNAAKFSQDESLREYLLGTGERVLVEASPVDRIWGIGLAADHVDVNEPRKWDGLNLLGFALMIVRDTLRA